MTAHFLSGIVGKSIFPGSPLVSTGSCPRAVPCNSLYCSLSRSFCCNEMRLGRWRRGATDDASDEQDR